MIERVARLLVRSLVIQQGAELVAVDDRAAVAVAVEATRHHFDAVTYPRRIDQICQLRGDQGAFVQANERQRIGGLVLESGGWAGQRCETVDLACAGKADLIRIRRGTGDHPAAKSWCWGERAGIGS